MALQPGTRLGSFEVLGPLGAGGMGEVYRARDTRLGREVAVKVLPQAFAHDPARAARFDREARLLATINHPAIAVIYGAEEFETTPFIIMELVPGETLSERLSRGRLPLEEALELARQIAEALEAAHEKGVIHRDLKPSNIKVTPDGKVKVLDFGLAKATEPASAENLSHSPTLPLEETRPGVVLGTVEFMSPEQARGKTVDKRTDIWAFGCILFEMLSGRRAFTGESAADVFTAVLSREPDWGALPARTPLPIRELLSRCLQKDPARRLRDIGDARMEIEGWREESGPVPSRQWTTSRRRLAAGAAALVVLLAGSAIWLLRRSSSPAPAGPPNRKQLAVFPFRNLTGDESERLRGVGLVETVSVRLSGLPGLQVLTPSSVVSAVDRNKEDLVTARDLGANVIVLGTLQRQGDKVRITYRVVDARTGAQDAANMVEGSASDIFALQDTLADLVAKDLGFPGARRRHTQPPGLDANQQANYLKAVGLLQRYDRRDAVEQSLEILRGLAGERPNSAPVQAALGRGNLALFAFTRDPSAAERAVASADTARSLDPALPEVDVTVGETLLVTGRAKEAADAFRRALAANPDDFQALLGLGGALDKTGEDAAAEASLRRAIELQPKSFAAYNHLGAIYSHRGRYRDAAEMFRKASILAPDSYRVWSNLGGVLSITCDFPGALEAFRKALALKPDNAVVASNLGVTQLWMGLYEEAIVSLELAARYSPKECRIRANLGDAYRAVLGKEDKAAEAYASAIAAAREQFRLNPRDAPAHSYAATSLAKTNHAAEAREEIRQALELDPKNPDILVDAGVVAALEGRSAEAIGFVRKAVEAGYCRSIIARQPEFEFLRKDPAFQAIVAAPHPAAGS